LSDEKANRLRNTAIAASRSFDAVVRMLEKRRKATSQPRLPAAKTAAAQPARPQPAPPLDLPFEVPGFPQEPARGRAAYLGSTSLTGAQRPAVAMP
jgi:hypothetical protein